MKSISNISPSSFNSLYSLRRNDCRPRRTDETFKRVKALAADSVEIRCNRVEQVKCLVRQGNYNVESSAVADKMIRDIRLHFKFLPERESPNE